jgi:ubiquinone/menaquinone biosynthesis C-methylase UbiE
MEKHQVWHYVDETERRKWQNPEVILQEAGLKAGQTFMDIGCGAGFFTLPAARIAGKTGVVYGLDIQENAIAVIRQSARTEGLTNIQVRAGEAEETLLCEACADIVFFGIVLHDFRDPARVLKNARRMIKPGGKLANLDWKKMETGMGPTVSKRIDEADATRLIEEAGFKVESIRDSGRYHYLVLARPV